MLTTWWIWMVLALVLAALEVVLPTYIFLGFAIGAAVTGVFLLVGGSAVVGVPAIVLIFALASLAGWVAVRLSLGVRDGQVKTFDRDINDG